MPTLFRERIVIPATAPAAAAVALSPAGAGQAPPTPRASTAPPGPTPRSSTATSTFEELNAYLRKSGVHYVNDFVASSDKSYAVYRKELEVTSRINKALGGRAFRGIALGESYFRLLGLNTTAPRIRAQK
ncbi:hypothetical protein ACWGOK_15860 [Streptomyces eurythermus]